MIRAWRICREAFADLSGEGARKYGGRWNSPGRPVVYLAEHPALAALEVLVHLDLTASLLPDDYVLLRVELPDEPPGHVAAVPDDPRAAGDRWLRDAATAVLRVPSVIIPTTTNILLNPLYTNAAATRITDKEPFVFDERLLRRGAG